jgi:hypothetical protein
MYARVVRFTDATRESVDNVKQRVEEQGVPPEGVKSTGMRLLFDEGQGTAVFVGFFQTEEDLREADAILGAMDASDVPGTRASVDQCVVEIERDV